MEADWRNTPLSMLTVTDLAKEMIGAGEIVRSLVRHSRLEWGELGERHAPENEWVLRRKQGMLLSAFRSRKGIEFYVCSYLSEGKALETMVVLRDEYWS